MGEGTWFPVAAVALLDEDGRILLQRRRLGGRHGGLWEFPGGKVEPGETPEEALSREIREEIGIELGVVRAGLFASDPEPDATLREPFVILLYVCRAWRGEPRALAGEEVAWFHLEEMEKLAMPPLDRPLVAALPALLGLRD